MTDKVIRTSTNQAKTLLPERFFTQLPKVFAQEGKLIYKGRNEVRIVQVGERKIVIKKYGVPPIFNRILYSWGIRTPKSVRSYQNAQEILKRGFYTPLPFLQEIHYHDGVLSDSYFVSTWANGTAVSAARKNGNLIRALARYTAKLHEQGMMHRDYILNNILFTFNDGTYQFELIDINRFIFQKRKLNWFYVCINLMQPFHDERKIKTFVTEYAKARKMNENLLIFWVLLFRRIRNGYSKLKEILRKLPGAHYFSRKAKRRRKLRR